MFSRIFFHLLVFPLSKCPLPVIYVVGDIFYFLIRTIFPYRKKVVLENLTRSFPHYRTKDIIQLKNGFYRHFADLLAEGIKNMSMSDTELLRRVKVTNPEVMDKLFADGKSVILAGGHFNNWEWVITAQNLLFKHKAIGIGKTLSNGYWDKKLNALRARFGMVICNAGNFKEAIAKNNDKPVAILTLTDQAPKDSSRSYWMHFLHQETPVLFGVEMMAHTYDYTVVYFSMQKIKRGYYSITLQTITDDVKKMDWGEITEKHTHLLEQDILKTPSSWLWSHNRWKREKPSNVDELKASQKQAFHRKFKAKPDVETKS